MPKKTNASLYAAEVETILAPIAEQNGVRIYDVEYVKEGTEFFLRCYIDKDGGVTIDDCENVSRALSDVLDESDPIPDAYTLEVSSPGLGRVLSKDRHLANSIGENVELKLYKPLEGTKDKEFEGILKSFDGETVTLTVDPKAKNRKKGQKVSAKAEENFVDMSFARKDIAIIRLTIDF